MKNLHHKFCVLTLFCTLISFAQQSENFTIHDSLKKLTYQELYNKYLETVNDTATSLIYLNTLSHKSRLENNKIKIAISNSFLHFYEKEESTKLKLLDSSIALSKHSNNPFFPLVPYSFKGGYHLNKGEYGKALDNYIKALDYAYKYDNKEYIYITKHNIGRIKSKIGQYDQALSILLECYQYEKKRKPIETKSYLSSILLLSETYTKIKKLDSSSFFVSKGIELAKHEDTEIYSRLLLNEGVNLFYQGKLNSASDSIHKSIEQLSKIQDKSYLMKAYFYIGKIKLHQKKHSEAESNFMLVDSIYTLNKYPLDIVHETYEYFIKSYKSKNDAVKQLHYIEKLLAYDSVSKSKNNFIKDRIQKEFDTPELISEKEKIIKSLESKNYKFTIFNSILVIITMLILVSLILNFIKRKTYQKKFQELLESKSENSLTKKSVPEGYKADYYIKIPQDIIDKVLDGLKQFEEDKSFVNPDINRILLAKEFETNPKYLSKIIHYHKQKNFNTYINDLRIDYIVNKLKEDKKIRNYTIKAIAQISGFNTSDAFSKYFYKKTGIHPSYFIKKIATESLSHTH